MVFITICAHLTKSEFTVLLIWIGTYAGMRETESFSISCSVRFDFNFFQICSWFQNNNRFFYFLFVAHVLIIVMFIFVRSTIVQTNRQPISKTVFNYNKTFNKFTVFFQFMKNSVDVVSKLRVNILLPLCNIPFSYFFPSVSL